MGWCDCYQCNNEFDGDEYIEWEYNQYKLKSENALPIEEWLKQFESKEEK